MRTVIALLVLVSLAGCAGGASYARYRAEVPDQVLDMVVQVTTPIIPGFVKGVGIHLGTSESGRTLLLVPAHVLHPYAVKEFVRAEQDRVGPSAFLVNGEVTSARVIAGGRFLDVERYDVAPEEFREDWAVVELGDEVRLESGGEFLLDPHAALEYRDRVVVVRGEGNPNGPAVVPWFVGGSPFDLEGDVVLLRSNSPFREGDSGSAVVLEETNTIIGWLTGNYPMLGGDVMVVRRVPPEALEVVGH